MQYKKMYEDSQFDLNQANRKIETEKDLRIEAETRLQEIQIAREKHEGMESIVKVENEWLRDTLRLLVLDGSKMKRLAEHIADEHDKRNQEMNMGIHHNRSF